MKAERLKEFIFILADFYLIVAPFVFAEDTLKILHICIWIVYVIPYIDFAFATPIGLIVKYNKGYQKYYNIFVDFFLIITWSYIYGDILFGTIIFFLRLVIIYKLLKYVEELQN